MYKCCICGADLNYLSSEENDGIIEFYECDNCNKIIAVSDIEEEEF